MNIETGNIIIVSELQYSGDYTQNRHDPYIKREFTRVFNAYRVDDISNNGKIKCHNRQRKARYIHALDSAPAPYIKRVIQK